MRDVMLTVFFLLVGVGMITVLTDNLQAFTAEGARRYAIAQQPKKLADYQLINSVGERVNFSQLSEKTKLIDFIYTRCPTVCSLLGSTYAKTQKKLLADKSLNDVALISISFDLTYDDAKALKAYQKRYSKTSAQWYVFVPSSKAQLQTMLAQFGVVVIRDKFGGFVHNSAIHITNNKGYLTKIIDWQNTKGINDAIYAHAN